MFYCPTNARTRLTTTHSAVIIVNRFGSNLFSSLFLFNIRYAFRIADALAAVSAAINKSYVLRSHLRTTRARV